MDSNNNNTAKREKRRRQSEKSRALILIGVIVSGSLVYYHCAYRGASVVSLISDVLIVLLCSLAILGLLFRQLTIQYFLFLFSFSLLNQLLWFFTNNLLIDKKYRVPVDPLEWQISQDTANSIVAWLANTIGAAESVLRVAATGHDKRLFFKVSLSLSLLLCLYDDCWFVRIAAGNWGMEHLLLHSICICMDW